MGGPGSSSVVGSVGGTYASFVVIQTFELEGGR